MELTVQGRNVNEVYALASAKLLAEAVPGGSRAGAVHVLPHPLLTVYERPTERVLVSEARRANPFFHVFEALWMLAGREDATFLDRFVKDFSARFAEVDGKQHGAYGFRWRSWFQYDQLNVVVARLRANPEERRVVLSMWDPVVDMTVNARDLPCNTHIYPRVRVEQRVHSYSYADVLDLTVCCRSNDAVWGAYGANAVHFSFLQEYLAARIGVGVGRLYQLSNNMHVYDATRGRLDDSVAEPYGHFGWVPTPLVDDPVTFDDELGEFLVDTDEVRTDQFENRWFWLVGQPMARVHTAIKNRDWTMANTWTNTIASPDWRYAVATWLDRLAHREETRT